jgi:hypothetical protein
MAAAKTLFDEMDSTVSYSAWRHVETEEGGMKMREYHVPNRTRLEMRSQGMEMVMIQRLDTGESWMLMPEMNTYMRIPASRVADSSGRNYEVIEQTEIGSETVNGHATTKYKAVFRDPEGRKGGGYFWLTEEHGIPVRMNLNQQTAQGQQRVHMELTELDIGPQPASRFELPDNYRAMPGGMGMVGMGDPYGGMSGNRPTGPSGSSYMERIEQMQAQRAQEGETRRAEQQARESALSQLTPSYLRGCWFPTREAAQIRINADGSYDVGTPAGSGYAMVRTGDSIQHFRNRFDGLVSRSDNRFVVTDRGREIAYERGECVSDSHSVAGPVNPAREYGSDASGDASGGNPLDKAADQIKRGIGSIFDRLK